MAKKKPLHIAANPARKAVPGKAVQPPAEDGLLRIRFGRFDLDGPWCLTKAADDLHMVLTAVRNFDTMTLYEVFKGHPGKDYSARDLPSQEARSRLADLKLDDQERISRLRVGGAGRLYGFRHGPDFWALWWDPRHEIWPSAQ